MKKTGYTVLVLCLVLAGVFFVNHMTGNKKSVDDGSLQKGDFLYEALENEKLAGIGEKLPCEIHVVRDDNGLQECADLTDPEDVKAAAEAFMQIRVGEETDVYVTDRYHSISFIFEAGEKIVIPLNDTNLEWIKNDKCKLYELEGIYDFWETAYQSESGR
ncbi:MAG: hypothetical protein SO016_01600 [Lachnospiraceae bacterium]|nr:hypothetical protein [Robinsoniella sp.]MDY3765377.1 hypothetical protein [Lachnospiraceae bacterium]